MLRLASAAVLGALLVAVLSCGSNRGARAVDDADVGADTTEATETISDNGSLDTELDAAPDVAPMARLAFVDVIGDDQVSCVGVDTCTLNPGVLNDRSLRVRYTLDGVPVAGVAIEFAILDDVYAVGQLSADSAPTDINGIAVVKVQVSLSCASSHFKVRAQVANDPKVPPLFFVARTIVDCLGGYLRVGFIYAGMHVFDGVTLYLYKSHAAASADLACADVDPIDLPSADLSKGPNQLSQTAKFYMLPGLDDEQEQFYTIVARGELMDGTPLAFGCNDTDGHVTLTGTNYVAIELHDIPPRVVGGYEVETALDLRSDTLPPAAQTKLGYMLTAIEAPSVWLLRQTCGSGDPGVTQICLKSFEDPDNPDANHLTPLGTAVLERMNVFLYTVPGWNGYDIFGLEAPVSEALKSVSVPALFRLNCEPDDVGAIPATCASAKWGVTTWGQDPMQPPSPFAALVENGPNNQTLSIAEHDVPLKAGQLLLDALQAHALPAVFGDGTDGLPAVDTLLRLFLALLSGRECLGAADGEPTCCERFGADLSEDAGAASAEELRDTCEAWVQGSAASLEQALLGLDSADDTPARLSTPTGHPCPIFDWNSDLKVDHWGREMPAVERCAWALTMSIGGEAVTVPASFFGVEYQ